MRRSSLASARRTVRRGLTWRAKQAGDRPLDVLALASPLRYDVVVRADFFGWLADEAVGRTDTEVVAGARDLPYRVWFTDIAMARFRPWVLREPALLEDQFAERVVSARRLAESVAERGFDPTHPVTLRRSGPDEVADSGVRLAKTLHVGDGGHRLALLLSRGSALEPSMYRVDPRRMPVLDNTAVLAGRLGLDEPGYARFVSAHYLDHPVASVGELRRAVASTAPERAGELDALLRAHGRLADVDASPAEVVDP